LKPQFVDNVMTCGAYFV